MASFWVQNGQHNGIKIMKKMIFFLLKFPDTQMAFLILDICGSSKNKATFGSKKHCTTDQQKELVEKSEISPKLPSYITFCHPGVTDDCTNQFLVKF